jgi:hypothetical protein
VKLAQNRFHKKTVSTALPKAKTALHQQRHHSFGIGTAELKVKPVEDLSLKGCQFEKRSEYGAVFDLYSCAKGKSYLFLATHRLNQRSKSRSRSRIRLDCFPTLPGKREIDFVRVAQNRHHKKPSVPLCRRLKRLFINRGVIRLSWEQQN